MMVKRCVPAIAAVLGTFVMIGGWQVAWAASPDAATATKQVDRLLREEAPPDDPAQQAARSSDATYLRRVFFDLIGQPPTADDALAFAFERSPDKRREVVELLLRDEAYGTNWARYWRDVILYRRTEDRALIAAQSLEDYLTEQFNDNAPWSDIAASFVTATGDIRENGNAALIMAQAGRPEDVTAEVSRIFLGIQIQCAQCHDHPTDRWKREQFHQLAAFFPRIAVRPDRNSTPPTFLVTVNDRSFTPRKRNNNNRFVGTPEHYMPDLSDPTSKGEKVQPAFFVSGEKLSFGTRDAERRGTIADWITSADNPWFAKAYVNRIWAELVGEGFYEPVDDMGPDRECSAPETMEYLATSFRENNYDVKWLYRTITATEAYQRASRGRRDYEDPAFQANVAQRLRGDQLFDSLMNALDLSGRLPQLARGGANMGVRGVRGPRAVFNLAFGYDPSEPREEIGGSIQQALAVMNSSFINQAINARRPDGLGGILRDHQDDRAALTELYVKTLSRAPTDNELRTCLSYIRDVGNRAEAFEDVQWSLINSTEFLHRK